MRKCTRVALVVGLLRVVSVSVAYAGDEEHGQCVDEQDGESLALDQGMSEACVCDVNLATVLDCDVAADASELDDSSCVGVCSEWCTTACEVDPAHVG